MQIKFVKTPDLEELESTANMLFLNGWERNTNVQVLPNGEFFMEFIKFGRMNRGDSLQDTPDMPPRPVTASAEGIAGCPSHNTGVR